MCVPGRGASGFNEEPPCDGTSPTLSERCRKIRASTAVAVLTLGLGIGANTTIFSLINALLLRPLPYKNPDALVALDLVNGQSLFPWSYPMFDELRRDQRTFESMAGFSTLDVNLTGIETPERLRCELVSASYFPMLGIEATRGRVFRPDEDREPDAHPLALVGHTLWRQKFGGDAQIAAHHVRRRGFCAAHRLREHGEYHDGPGYVPPEGDCRPAGDRGEPGCAHSPASHRKRDSRLARRHCRIFHRGSCH